MRRSRPRAFIINGERKIVETKDWLELYPSPKSAILFGNAVRSRGTETFERWYGVLNESIYPSPKEIPIQVYGISGQVIGRPGENIAVYATSKGEFRKHHFKWARR